MNPKDLRIGATLSLKDVIVTHRYDTYLVVRFASGETGKVSPEVIYNVVDQPMEDGDLVRRLGYGGICRFVQYLNDRSWCTIIVKDGDDPIVVKTSNVSLVDPNYPKGLRDDQAS